MVNPARVVPEAPYIAKGLFAKLLVRGMPTGHPSTASHRSCRMTTLVVSVACRLRILMHKLV